MSDKEIKMKEVSNNTKRIFEEAIDSIKNNSYLRESLVKYFKNTKKIKVAKALRGVK